MKERRIKERETTMMEKEKKKKNMSRDIKDTEDETDPWVYNPFAEYRCMGGRGAQQQSIFKDPINSPPCLILKDDDQARADKLAKFKGKLLTTMVKPKAVTAKEEKAAAAATKKKKKNKMISARSCAKGRRRVYRSGQTSLVITYVPLPSDDPIDPLLSAKDVSVLCDFVNNITANNNNNKDYEYDHDDEGGGNDYQQQEKTSTGKRKRRSIVLTAKEKLKDSYRRMVDGDNNNNWKSPLSPYNLLQEEHSFDPWRVIVICMLLNVTQGVQVRRVLEELFYICPNAKAATVVCVEKLQELIKPLGLKKRANTIKRFSSEYLGTNWTHVTQLYGVGKYAADAYAIFCAGKADEVVPVDHKLVKYWNFVRGKQQDEHNIPEMEIGGGPPQVAV